MNLQSTKFSLKVRDFIKGFGMAVGTPLLYFVQDLIPGWTIDPIYKIAISAAVTYLLKNYFSNDVANAQKVLDEAKKKAEEKQAK